MAEERAMFSEWIATHARGTLHDEVTAALGELVEAVTHLGKSGKLTLELVVEPAGAGGRTVAIGGRVTRKPPLPAPELGIFYVGEAGSLHRDDPFAQRLPGVPFAGPGGEIRVVDPETGEIRRVDAPSSAPKRVEEDPDA